MQNKRGILSVSARGLGLLLLPALLSGSCRSGHEPGTVAEWDRQEAFRVLEAVNDSWLDRIYFGEFHAHTSFSLDAWAGQVAFLEGHRSRTPCWAYDYARNTAGLDFVSLNDHADEPTPLNDILLGQVSEDCGWDYATEGWTLWGLNLDIARRYTRECEEAGTPDCLIIYPGFEFTGTVYGHKNVVFRSLDAVPAERYPSRTGEDILEERPPELLWEWLRDQAPDLGPGYAFLTIIHTPGEEPAHDSDWSHLDGGAMPLAEVFSKHGNSECDEQGCYEPIPEQVASKTLAPNLRFWLLDGSDDYRLGFVGGTDTHTSKPGNVTIEAENVEFLSNQMFKGGAITGVLAEERSREAIWEAVESRRTYATSGPKVRLAFSLYAGGEAALMGEKLSPAADSPLLLLVSARVEAPQVLDRVEFVKNGEIHEPLCSLSLEDAEEAAASCEDRFLAGQRAFYYARVYLRDDTRPAAEEEHINLAWPSPVWVE